MGKQFETFQDDHLQLIAESPLFFVGTAAPGSRVNVSPKGMDSLRVAGPARVLWLNATGSGNETAAHLALDPRMTLMWCSFSTRPIILRAYGRARAVHRGEADWAQLAPALPDLPGARQIIEMSVEMVQSSCGFAVPFMTFDRERPVLRSWAEDKGEDGLRTYWDTRNRTTIDGLPTGIEKNL
jgi:hypothetical protein